MRARTAPSTERVSYDHVVLTGRLRDAALRINADLPASVVEQAVTRLLRAESQNALAENERVHRLLTGRSTGRAPHRDRDQLAGLGPSSPLVRVPLRFVAR
jgi:type I site-specific restriction-modification system R (restriction) subunit